MIKPYKFTVRSDRRCLCGSRLKKNVVERKPTAELCYACGWLSARAETTENLVKRDYLLKRVGQFK